MCHERFSLQFFEKFLQFLSKSEYLVQCGYLFMCYVHKTALTCSYQRSGRSTYMYMYMCVMMYKLYTCVHVCAYMTRTKKQGSTMSCISKEKQH